MGPVTGRSSNLDSRPNGLILPMQPDGDEVVGWQWSHVLEDLAPGLAFTESLYCGVKRLLLALVHQERGVQQHQIDLILVHPCLDGQRLESVQQRGRLRLTLALERGGDTLAQLDALVLRRLGWLAGEAIAQRADVVVLGHDLSKEPLLVPEDLELRWEEEPDGAAV